jgi:hypothetical protein
MTSKEGRTMTKNPAAVALGKLGGKVSTYRKAEAVRENGKLGGRPKGSKNKKKAK